MVPLIGTIVPVVIRAWPESTALTAGLDSAAYLGMQNTRPPPKVRVCGSSLFGRTGAPPSMALRRAAGLER